VIKQNKSKIILDTLDTKIGGSQAKSKNQIAVHDKEKYTVALNQSNLINEICSIGITCRYIYSINLKIDSSPVSKFIHRCNYLLDHIHMRPDPRRAK
jgi:hypothetical protein